MVLVELCELLVPGLPGQYGAQLRVVKPREERHPDDFLERLGTFGSDIDAVTVRSFARRLVAVSRAIDEPAPEPRRQHRWKVPIAMAPEFGRTRRQLEQDSGTRGREPGEARKSTR